MQQHKSIRLESETCAKGHVHQKDLLACLHDGLRIIFSTSYMAIVGDAVKPMCHWCDFPALRIVRHDFSENESEVYRVQRLIEVEIDKLIRKASIPIK